MSNPRVKLCVLASSSSGNCSLLSVSLDGKVFTVLIDAGLSPRRTRALLESTGHGRIHIDHVILTHLDCDHWNTGWLEAMPEATTVHLHKRHVGRAGRMGLTYLRTQPFTDSFEVLPGIVIHPLLVAHDDLGTAAFRIDFPACGRSLGYATDMGRPSQELCEHLAGVDILAIESNYCPRMQLASSRPDFLKQRIMGGRGHLSNEESARAVTRMAPRETVVLLHLSRQCNTPETAAQHHAYEGRRVIVSSDREPTGWIHIAAPELASAARMHAPPRPATTLWGG